MIQYPDLWDGEFHPEESSATLVLAHAKIGDSGAPGRRGYFASIPTTGVSGVALLLFKMLVGV